MRNRHKHRQDELQFKLLLVATLPVFIVATLVGRLMPWNWGRDDRSLFVAARCAAYNALPFAFM